MDWGADELTAPALEPTHGIELDAIARDVLGRLDGAGYFPAGAPEFPAVRFADLDQRVRATFSVPHTTMTALTRRVLYGIAAARRPAVTVALGTFVGYAPVWLFGPAIPPDPMYPVRLLAGCDIFAAAIEQARANLAALCVDHGVSLTVADAYEFLDNLTEPIDLLYLDVDSAERGKSDYLGLLRRAEHRLGEGALVVAHDVTHEYYRDDVAPYLAAVRDKARYRSTATLQLDPCGLEVTLV